MKVAQILGVPLKEAVAAPLFRVAIIRGLVCACVHTHLADLEHVVGAAGKRSETQSLAPSVMRPQLLFRKCSSSFRLRCGITLQAVVKPSLT